jgi:hypothetical protein
MGGRECKRRERGAVGEKWMGRREEEGKGRRMG